MNLSPILQTRENPAALPPKLAPPAASQEFSQHRNQRTLHLHRFESLPASRFQIDRTRLQNTLSPYQTAENTDNKELSKEERIQGCLFIKHRLYYSALSTGNVTVLDSVLPERI